MTQPQARTALASRIWHAMIAVVIAASLVTQLVLLFSGGRDANSDSSGTAVGVGTRLVRLFSYFTIESNVIVLVIAVTLALRPDRDGRRWRVARLDSILGIVITGLVFAIVLAPQLSFTGAALWATIGFHYVAPVTTLVGWLVLGPRPRITWRTVAWAFAWPAAWIVYTFVHGAVTDWYPYSFLDAGAKGYATALVNTVAVIVLAAALAIIAKVCDHRLPARFG